MLFSGPVFENMLLHCHGFKLTLKFVLRSQAINNRGGEQGATGPLIIPPLAAEKGNVASIVH